FTSLLLFGLGSCASLEDYAPGGGDVRETLSVNLGQRVFDHASTNCIDEQLALGVEYTMLREDGAFGYEFGLHNHNERKDILTTGRTRVDGWELTAGLRREFPIEGTSITPYAGLGLSMYTVERQNELAGFPEGHDSGPGIYGRVGARMTVSEAMFIGIDVRLIQEEFLKEGKYDLDGDVVSFVVGWSL
ncbi:MAG: hypothetical protein ACI84E_001030, partial [Planctomycetota bacterium]